MSRRVCGDAEVVTTVTELVTFDGVFVVTILNPTAIRGRLAAIATQYTRYFELSKGKCRSH